MNNPHAYPKRPLPKEQLIMGIHAIHEVLLHAPQKLIRVFSEKVKQEGRKSDLIDLCGKKKIPITFVSFDALTQMAGSDSHQSLVAEIAPRNYLNISTFLDRVEQQESSFVLMLDQIFDPQNFGALLRSAECFGVDGVVWSKNRGADLTPVAAKASSGASEIIPLIRISNLAEGVSQFQKAGFEAVAAVLDPKAVSCFKFQFAQKTLLIVGSEGEGIQPLIQKRADRTIYIPMRGKISSLNVAQATAVLLSRLESKEIFGVGPTKG